MKEDSVGKGFAVLSLAGIIVKILSFIYIPFLLAIIGEEGNGIYAAAYQVYVFVYVITNAGLPVAISKAVSEFAAVENYVDAVRSFKIARFFLMVTGFVLSLLLLLLSSRIADWLNFEKSALAILALSPSLLLTAVASSYRGYFQGRGNMVPTALSQIIEQIANTVFTLILAAIFIRSSLPEACAGGAFGTTLGALFSVMFLILFYHKNHRFPVPAGYHPSGIRKHSYSFLVKKILGYSIPITLAVGMQYAGNLIDLWNTKARLLTAGFADHTATEMYSYLYKYQQLMNLPISVIVALAIAILPAISGAAAQKNSEQIYRKINYAFRLCFMISIPAAIGFAVLSQAIFGLLKYGEGSYLLLYGSFVLVLMSVVQIQTTVLQGINRLYLVTFNLLLGIAAKIAVNYFLIALPKINILGAVIGSVVGFSIPLVLNLWVIRRHLGVELNLFKISYKPLLAALAMIIPVYTAYTLIHYLVGMIGRGYITNGVATIVAVLVGAVFYFLILIRTGGILQEDIRLLPRKLTQMIPKRYMERIKQS